MSNLIFNQNNPLAHIDQSQILKQKIMSIHTTDRDKTKWPYGNEFEIQLPEKMTNVQSMRLVTISLPTNQYVFSNEYQNTKLSFSVTFDSSNNKTKVFLPGGPRAWRLEPRPPPPLCQKGFLGNKIISSQKGLSLGRRILPWEE